MGVRAGCVGGWPCVGEKCRVTLGGNATGMNEVSLTDHTGITGLTAGVPHHSCSLMRKAMRPFLSIHPVRRCLRQRPHGAYQAYVSVSISACSPERNGWQQGEGRGGTGADGVRFRTARLKFSDYLVYYTWYATASCNDLFRHFYFQRLAHTQSGKTRG